ncbi:MAG TPA: glycosyl hydrolase [Anaerolineae bacterium]|nr:glycosyl hydrolase [Anaerolineae bacterium]
MNLLLGTRKGLIILNQTNNNWQTDREHLPGVPVSYACRDPRTNHIWLLTDHGHWGTKIYRSTDNGQTIHETPAPQFPPDATIYDLFAGGQQKPATVTYLWTLTPGGPDQPGRLYLGTEPGGLFQSDDNGDSWHLVESLWNHPSRQENWFGGGRDQAGLCSLVVDPRDSNHLYAGISVGGVYESTDGGQTWHGRNHGLIAEYLPNPHAEYGHDPHYLVASPSNPDILWQQNHCGVFRSADRAATWQNRSLPDNAVKFGFPIHIDEHDADTAWVIPAVSDDQRVPFNSALYVAHTTDGGQTWHQQRNGLPQQNCYDLVYRHALDGRGDTLIFGTTNGNLYLSTNRGQNWTSLGHSFPPIYSVRFA